MTFCALLLLTGMRSRDPFYFGDDPTGPVFLSQESKKDDGPPATLPENQWITLSLVPPDLISSDQWAQIAPHETEPDSAALAAATPPEVPPSPAPAAGTKPIVATEAEPRPPTVAKSADEPILDPGQALPSEPDEALLNLLAQLDKNKPETYRLGIGDMLRISVYGDEHSFRNVPVDPSGNITYMVVGTMKATGRTIDELKTELQERMDREMKFQMINIVPQQFNSQSYTITGMLDTPGVYPLQGGRRILDAIAEAKGFRSGDFRGTTIELADLYHATLIRGNDVLPIDFERLIRRGDHRFNIPLQNGDLITIPSALERQIYVLGEVGNPRSIDFYSASINLLQALTEAKGLNSYTADGRVIIIRGRLFEPQVYVVNVKKIMAGQARNVQLRPGDIIYAPPKKFAYLRDTVLSAVRTFAVSAAGQSGRRAYERADPLGTGRQADENIIINNP